MLINFFSEDVNMPDFCQSEIRAWIQQIVFNYQKKVGELNFIFCSDEYLLDINKKYLNHDYYTDIITFNYCEDNIISGDIFISVERVAENAKIYKSEGNELFRVIIHGVLHLLGFNDSTPEEQTEMRAKEDECLSKLNPESQS